jgi:RimJ/RimL family protein N-acetyltransferase
VAGFRDALSAVCRERKYLAWIEAPPLEKARAFVAMNVRNGWPQFVAVDGDRIVGWCDAIPGDSSAGTAHIGRLGMGILPEFRGRGLGTRLLEATVARARELRLGKIELSVYASNAPAIALYRKCGFVDEGRRRRGRLVDGVYDDVVLMALDLAPPSARGQPGTGVAGV